MINTSPSKVMHIDLNSCFASVEQQANPKLRGRPVVVAAYPTDGGCILTASVEAKKLGIKTGMRVREAKEIFKNVIVLNSDPPKYRHVHKEMMKIFESFCPDVTPKSIDEAVLNFSNAVSDSPSRHPEVYAPKDLFQIGQKIKKDIKEKIGEWLTVSVGIAPNRFLAKTAASLKKPDGLEEISHKNIIPVFSRLLVEDLCGIGPALKFRLNDHGIFSALDFLNAKHCTLDATFRSILAYHWYLRLRGFEVDDWQTQHQSIGHSYALPKPTSDLSVLRPILYRLCEKVGRRLRLGDLEARGVYLSTNIFHQSRQLPQSIADTVDIFNYINEVMGRMTPGNGQDSGSLISILAAGVFKLSPSLYQQQTIFEDQIKKKNLTKALDKINNKFGEFSVTTANVLGLDRKILDRIAFGGIKDI